MEKGKKLSPKKLKQAKVLFEQTLSNPVNPDHLDLDVGQYFTMSSYRDFILPPGIYKKAINAIEKDIKYIPTQSKIDYLQKLKIQLIEAGRVFKNCSIFMDHSGDIYIIDKVIDFINTIIIAKVKLKTNLKTDAELQFSDYFKDPDDYNAIIKILETKVCIEKMGNNDYEWIGIDGKKGEVSQFISALIDKEYLINKIRKKIATAFKNSFTTDVSHGTARKIPTSKGENEFLKIIPTRKNLSM